MAEARVETGVDELIGFLDSHGKSSLKEASTALNIPEATLQLWVDFLVEERILGLEYKFTKPYVFLNKEDKARSLLQGGDSVTKTVSDFRDEFFTQAKKKQLPESTIQGLWQAHLDEALEQRKEFFLREAKKRYVEKPEQLFIIYKRKLARM
jgi:hypothetical protein